MQSIGDQTMKKIINILPTYSLSIVLAFLTFFSISSCGEDAPESTSEVNVDEDYYEFKGLSLSKHDIDAMIMLPDNNANIGASTKPEIIHDEGGYTWEINVGPNFQLFIEDQADYKDLIEVEKKRLKEEDMFKITYLVDEKDLLIYERELMVRGHKNASSKVGVKHKSFHVYGVKNIDGIYYDLRSRPDGYEKVIIELVAKSIKSFKPIK